MVVVAGHVCLDIICTIGAANAPEIRPGALSVVGPASLTPGGCVSNTGGSLVRLGVPTRFVGKVGRDVLGDLVSGLLSARDEQAARYLVRAEDEATSYSVIISPQHGDRSILHYPGCNSSFSSGDVPSTALDGAAIFHFGYPPLMRAMYADQGVELEKLLALAHAAGLVTSLDLAYPDPFSETPPVDWAEVLSRALRQTDLFLPSLEEYALMMMVADRSPTAVARLASWAIEQGAAVVGIKCGDRGLYMATSSSERLKLLTRSVPIDLPEWIHRQIWAAAFSAEVVGTTGAGDAAIAGLLAAVLEGRSPEQAASAACAVGAYSVEQADSTSGIASWHEVQARIAAGWNLLPLNLPPDWKNAAVGVWTGPSDRRARQSEVYR
ncbi:MAG: carbohydrate kinase family protein [Candidatus Dormibacteraceae bacterium]